MILFFFCFNVFSYDEMREIELIHGIDQNHSLEYILLENLLSSWSKTYNIKKPKLNIVLKNRYQAYFNLDEYSITLHVSPELNDYNYMRASMAHEFAHAYFYYNRVELNDQQEEKECDRLALKLSPIKYHLELLKYKIDLLDNKHLAKKQRIKFLKGL